MYKQVPVNSSDLMEFLAPAPSLFGHHMDFFFFFSFVSLLCILKLFFFFFPLNLNFSPLSVIIEYVSFSDLFIYILQVQPYVPKWNYSIVFSGGGVFLCVFIPKLLYPYLQ